MVVQKGKLEKSINRLVARDDTRLTKEQVEYLVGSGQWTDESFVDYLEQHAIRIPNFVAITDENGKNTTYAQLHQQTDRLALALLELGIQPHDRIAVQLPNCSEFILSLMGAAKASILPVFCHMPYTEHDLEYVIELTEPKAMIIVDAFKSVNYISLIKQMQKKYKCLEHIIVVSDQHYEGTINFYDLLQQPNQSQPFELENVRPVGTDPFFIMFTSGTTGKPKAALHLHANNLYYVEQLNQTLSIPEDGNLLVAPPLAHLTGLAFGVLTTLQRGGSVVLLSSWNVKKAVELIQSENVSCFLGVTPMLIDLVRYANLENADICSLEKILYAGAPCPAEILNNYKQKYNCEIMAFYGYTEAGLTHSTKAGDDTSITSISFGKVAKGIEAKIIDGSGNELQGPCEGEVVVRGANFIPGYFRQPENNEKMFDAEGWFHSSDIVRMDQNGYCIFLARKDDLINRGGYKIDPREIEEVLYTHPLISQAVVVGIPDERLGERIASFIILKDSSQTINLEDVTSYLSEMNFSKKHWPEVIKIVESFPMTASGKIQRFAMIEHAEKFESAHR